MPVSYTHLLGAWFVLCGISTLPDLILVLCLSDVYKRQEDDIAEIDDDFQLVVSGWSVYVESLNLTPVYYTHLDVYKRQDWDCTDMTHFMGMDCVFNGEMRMERLKDMFRGKISKKSLVSLFLQGKWSVIGKY